MTMLRLGIIGRRKWISMNIAGTCSLELAICTMASIYYNYQYYYFLFFMLIRGIVT